MSLVFIIDQNFHGQVFMFPMNRDNIRRYDGFVAEMWVIVTLPVEKFLPLSIEIHREEIPDSGVFELGLLVLFFPPIVAITHVVFRIPHGFNRFFVLHSRYIYIN